MASTWQTRLATFRPRFEKFAESEPNIQLRVVKLPKDHPDGEVVMVTLVESTLTVDPGRIFGAPQRESDSGPQSVAPCSLFVAADRAETEKGFLVGERSLVRQFELLASQAAACLPPEAIRENGILFSAPVTRHWAWASHSPWVVFLFQQLDECPGSFVRRGWFNNALCFKTAQMLERELSPEARAQGIDPYSWIRQYETVSLEVNPFLASVYAIDLALNATDPVKQAEGSDTANDLTGDEMPASGKANGFVFAPDGDGYFIVGFGESGHFTKLLGFQYIHRLLHTPGLAVPMLDLIGATNDKRQSADKRSRQESLDSVALRSIQKRLSELDSDLDAAKKGGNEAEVNELEEKKESLLAEVRKAMGKGGRVRDLNNPLDRLRPRISNRIRDAIEKLRECDPPLKQLAEHFDLSIGSEQGQYVYRNSASISWRTELPPIK